MLSEGAYSDFQNIALCRAKCDLDTEALSKEYFELYPDQAEELHFKGFTFAKWLTVDKRDMVEEIKYWGWHLASYYTFRPLVSFPPERH